MRLCGLAAWWQAKRAGRPRHPFDSAGAEERYELLDQASMPSPRF